VVVQVVLAGLAATVLVVVGVAIVQLLRAEPTSPLVELTDAPTSPERVGRRS
jgi:hypothetical protein